jgi:murein DD-endopeptidase MepM/ murein hydrolase activator NlpD
LSQRQVGESLRELNFVDNEPIGIALLTGNTLSSFFDQATSLESLRTGIEQEITNLSSLKTNLLSTKQIVEQKRQELASLKQILSSQQMGLTVTKSSQTQLLTQTQNQESTYQKMIAQKKAQESQFEKDLQDFEGKLDLSFSSTSLPPTGSQPLAWPLASVRITQYFGNTAFATANSQVYNGHGHNAIDLAANIGTPLLAARDGIVVGTGNTDATCAGASYGKWVFIKHNDGLSTLYAHLSVIQVTKGQSVTQGETIGLSGQTGYATGPHLHFSVMATAGSEIASFASKSCIGKTYTMPVADQTAYLNPLSFLPPVPKK